MTSVKIFILFGLLALGFLIPSEVAARDIGAEFSSGRDEVTRNPIITLVRGADHKDMNQSNIIQNHKSIEFDVHNDDYMEFIQTIRDELKDSESHGIPVLTPQRYVTAENITWLDIRLVAGDSIITVRIQQSNLYVRGYSRSTDDFFWEFRDQSLIFDSRDLRFSESYVKAHGIVATAGIGSRENLQLGHNPLENAIHALANLERPDQDQQTAAKNLLVIVQMIAEAARFRTISEHIATNYWNKEGPRLDARMVAMENGWGQLSTAMLQADRNPTPNTPLLIPNPNPTEVYLFREAVAALGILLLTVSKTKATIMMTNEDYGRSLMNLEYVRVNNIDGEAIGELYGTVRVDDGWFTYTFYDRGSSDYESVGPGGFATLTDSAQSFPVSGADSFTITVDLFDEDFLSDDKIAQGEIVWDQLVESITFENYDKHLQQVVKGEDGQVTVGYSVLTNALGVTIQVILVNGDGENEAEVYGTLKASQILGGSAGSTPITLFRKSAAEYVEVRQGHPIPLTRTVIAASTSTKLTITADLWDYDPVKDDAIAQGSVDFTVQPGEQKKTINGRYGQVRVIVTFE